MSGWSNDFAGNAYESYDVDWPKMATCGYCDGTDEAADMHRCWNCTEHTCTGCYKDTGRCSYCGISDAEMRVLALED